jgi:uncharacterized protein (TIGR01777 family)
MVGLRYRTVVGAPLPEVLAWHARPGAIHRLMPPWQPLGVSEEATSLEHGRAVLRLPGGLSWVAEHRALDPAASGEQGFVDELTNLPLRWRHTHRFEAVEGPATRITDTVDTPVPGSLLVQTFRYRARQVEGDLAAHRRSTALGGRPRTVAVTGSSGLIGTALCAYLSTGGHRVVHLVRREPRGADERRWEPERPDPAVLEGVDAVVHLAGASIAGRFTAAHKEAVRQSRIGPTAALAHAAAELDDGPGVLICASAIGWYGTEHRDEPLTEDEGPGAGFLARLVEEWEAAAQPARDAGRRVVHVRTGIVQSARGGSLRLLRPLFAMALGGPLAPGSQWVSWIGLDDLLDIFGHALADDTMVGPVNAVAPHPTTNAEYAAVLGRVLRRPAVIPVPGIGPRLLLGAEGAREMVQASQRVVPARLETAGHTFRYPDLESCLRHELGHDDEPTPGEEIGPGPAREVDTDMRNG